MLGLLIALGIICKTAQQASSLELLDKKPIFFINLNGCSLFLLAMKYSFNKKKVPTNTHVTLVQSLADKRGAIINFHNCF